MRRTAFSRDACNLGTVMGALTAHGKHAQCCSRGGWAMQLATFLVCWKGAASMAFDLSS